MTGRVRLYRRELVLIGEGTIVGWRHTITAAATPPGHWSTPPGIVHGVERAWPIVRIDDEDIDAVPHLYETTILPDPLASSEGA